jgi:YfiH family protein
MLRQSLLERCGVEHGFGLRDAPAPEGLLRPRQVHGIRVVTAAACRAQPAPEADAVISREPGVPVGIVTADCVPVLIASERGDGVAAVHAGWRGLAAGVVARGVDALRRSGCEGRLLAAVGPHIGPCCYEVDAPVLDPLHRAFGSEVLAGATREARPGHALLDLAALSVHALRVSGLDPGDIGVLSAGCTRCDPTRFHSYRRDGPRAGRLVHYVAAIEA